MKYDEFKEMRSRAWNEKFNHLCIDLAEIKNDGKYRVFNEYVDQNKKVPQYINFRCGLLHIEDSLKKIGKLYKLQPCLLKKELGHDELFEDNWEERENEWLPYL